MPATNRRLVSDLLPLILPICLLIPLAMGYALLTPGNNLCMVTAVQAIGSLATNLFVWY